MTEYDYPIEMRAKPIVDEYVSLHRAEKPPTLVILTVGDDDASAIYVRNKIALARKLNIEVRHVSFAEDTQPATVIAIIQALNEDDNVNGIIVQLPLPAHFNVKTIQSVINPAKDVDGFSPNSPFNPCTPAGILTLLDWYNIPTYRRNVVVVGRSEIVGKPMARLFLERDCTVSVCHSKTDYLTLRRLCRNADIIVCAAGVRNLISEEMISHEVPPVLIDVGINRDENGKVCGDIDPACYHWAQAYTPVPGGVGPMTVLQLMDHTMQAASRG